MEDAGSHSAHTCTETEVEDQQCNTLNVKQMTEKRRDYRHNKSEEYMCKSATPVLNKGMEMDSMMSTHEGAGADNMYTSHDDIHPTNKNTTSLNVKSKKNEIYTNRQQIHVSDSSDLPGPADRRPRHGQTGGAPQDTPKHAIIYNAPTRHHDSRPQRSLPRPYKLQGAALNNCSPGVLRNNVGLGQRMF